MNRAASPKRSPLWANRTERPSTPPPKIWMPRTAFSARRCRKKGKQKRLRQSRASLRSQSGRVLARKQDIRPISTAPSLGKRAWNALRARRGTYGWKTRALRSSSKRNRFVLSPRKKARTKRHPSLFLRATVRRSMRLAERLTALRRLRRLRQIFASKATPQR